MAKAKTTKQSHKAPPAPKHLPPAQKALWNRIAGSFPTDWFKDSDLPLLLELCRALHTADELANSMEGVKNLEVLKKFLDLRDREARRAASLSRTLRLPPQSRYDRQAAATAGRDYGQRPWKNQPDDFSDF